MLYWKVGGRNKEINEWKKFHGETIGRPEEVETRR